MSDQAVDQALAVVVEQRVVRPGDRRARQQQDDGVVERQVEGIEHLDALRRPDAAGEFGPGVLRDLVREQAGVEEGPEPGDEEHHLGGDEHDHAVAQVQRHDPRVVALMAFLDGVRPPGEHGVEHDGQADEEQPRRREVQPEEVELVALQVLHPGDAADRHDERADGADERPRARIDDVVVVLRFCVACASAMSAPEIAIGVG